ncbi:MAG: molybdate ABC transporter substrate-binding protein [Pseudomonadota bacterium]
MRAASSETVTVYAASSLKPWLDDLVPIFEAKSQHRVTPVFGSSALLARQIGFGAKADVFLSADRRWSAEVVNAVVPATRERLAGNALVLVSGGLKEASVAFDWNVLGDKRVAVGRTNSVPVGRYAREAMENLGVWSQVQPSLVETQNAAATLSVLQTGGVDFGIVYASDMSQYPQFSEIFRFPASSHRSIEYEMLVLSDNSKATQSFSSFLTSDLARKALKKFGLTVLE